MTTKDFETWWKENYPNTDNWQAYYAAKRAYEDANRQAWREAEAAQASAQRTEPACWGCKDSYVVTGCPVHDMPYRRSR